MLFGGAGPVTNPLQAVEGKLNALDTHARGARAPGPDAAAQAIAAPLFATSSLTPSAPEVAVKVLGIARTPSGSAALLSINNGPADWLAVGASKDGVTLQEVTASAAIIDTPGGTRTVPLGETSTPSPAAPATPQPAPATGVRMPPAPASAPGQHR
jgi:hypothetical protein